MEKEAKKKTKRIDKQKHLKNESKRGLVRNKQPKEGILTRQIQ